MTRVNVTRTDCDGATTVEGWFNTDKATRYDEDTWWDGSNNISKATGSEWDHQHLYRTAQGRWVLAKTSQRDHIENTYEFISDAEAKEWLIAQANDDAVTEHFGELEEECGPGLPAVGGAVHVSLGDELAALDKWAASKDMNRAQAIREAVRRLLHAENAL